MAAAACLVLAVGLGAYLVLEMHPQTTVRNAPVEADITPGDGSVLERPPEALSWSAHEDRRYRLIVYDNQARRLWTSETVDSGRIELPESVREAMAPGVYYWQLRVVDSGTVEGPYAFEVAGDDGQ
jgi:hypothetical protein